jgi:PDZ domain-containing secreted protein
MQKLAVGDRVLRVNGSRRGEYATVIEKPVGDTVMISFDRDSKMFHSYVTYLNFVANMPNDNIDLD